MQTTSLVKELYTEYVNLTAQQYGNNPILKWTKKIDILPKKISIMANKHMKRCLISLVVREMK